MKARLASFGGDWGFAFSNLKNFNRALQKKTFSKFRDKKKKKKSANVFPYASKTTSTRASFSLYFVVVGFFLCTVVFMSSFVNQCWFSLGNIIWTSAAHANVHVRHAPICQVAYDIYITYGISSKYNIDSHDICVQAWSSVRLLGSQTKSGLTCVTLTVLYSLSKLCLYRDF